LGGTHRVSPRLWRITCLHFVVPAVLGHARRYWRIGDHERARFLVNLDCRLGAALGDWLSYWLGAHFQHRVAGWWPLSRYPQLLPKGEAFFKRWGWIAIVVGRFSGPLRATVPLAAGITHMPMMPFQLANFGSAFLWAASLMLPGTYFARFMPL
jgi:membrane protein DedA with SNARE-associated domain